MFKLDKLLRAANFDYLRGQGVATYNHSLLVSRRFFYNTAAACTELQFCQNCNLLLTSPQDSCTRVLV
jgi:hypothetical protein